MDKDKLRKKIEKASSDLRKKAIAVEQALTDAERRRLEEEQRPKYGIGDYEYIIESGNPIIQSALLLKDHAASKAYGEGVHLLTKEQRARLLLALDTPTGNAVLKQTTEIYEGAVAYGKYIVSLRSQWQRAIGDMASLLTRWTAADEVAKGMTETLRKIQTEFNYLNPEAGWINPETGEAPKLSSFAQFLIHNFEEAMAESPYKVYFNFNAETQEFEADIDKGGLYSAILKSQKRAEYQLQALKSAVEPFSDFLYSNVTFANGEEALPLWFIPEVVDRIMEYPDAVEFDGDPNNRKYFQYHLLKRKNDGETITPMDEKRAVIPDYNQVTEIPRHRYAADIKLINLFKQYLKKEDDGKKD